MTCPIIFGGGAISEREGMTLVILSLLLIIFNLAKLKRLVHFTIFLSMFISIFLSSQFIFLNKIDLLLFQAIVLILLFFQKKNWRLDNFSLGIIYLAIVTFLLQFFVNRVLLGFYLNFWIDLKRHFPVFLFCMAYFIIYPVRSKSPKATVSPSVGISNGTRISNGVTGRVWTGYFAGLFIITSFLSYFNPGEGKGIVTRKIERNLAFFYRDREMWKDMSSSLRRGLVYEYLGLWSKARNEFKKIIISSPEDINAHFNLARSYAAEKLWYEAISEYNKVIELDPYYRGSHCGLARAYKAVGEIVKAEMEFLKEIEINPKGINSYLALEELYERQGLVKKMHKIRSRRLEKITASIDKKDISDANLRILPVVLDGGKITVEIVARGTYAQDFWPRMEVWLSVAGKLVRGGDAWVKSEDWKSYYFHFKSSPGEEKIIIHFTNDFFGGVDNDRNLYIKRVNFIYGR